MNIIKRFIIVFAVAATVAAGSVAYAQTSDGYLKLVQDNCSELKTTIEAQRKHDLVTRINKGRAYQTVLDQQHAFSQRLKNNKLAASQFEQQTAEVQAGVERFRTAYNRYDDALGTLLSVNCSAQPQVFAEQLLVARALRAIIGGEVAGIEASLAAYRQTVVVLQQEIEQLNEAISEATP